MDIVFKIDNKDYYIRNNGIVYLMGPNSSGKTYFLNKIKTNLEGKGDNVLVNGLNVYKGDYNVIYFDDTTDFNNEFKFTKTNLFRKLIYEAVLDKFNEVKLLNEVNDLFDRVDNKVNKYLDINVNKRSREKLNFDIEIDNLDEIIDKFTNIYVDNYLVKDSNLPKSIRRKLIYNLILLEVNKSENINNIVIIDNFDLYLDISNIKYIINILEDYHRKNPNTYFFLSSNNNIYELINDKESIYKVNMNSLKHIKSLETIVERALLKDHYLKSKVDMSFKEFENNNDIILNNEVENKMTEIMLMHQAEIGKFYISNNIKIVKKHKINYNDIVIYYMDDFYKFFYEELFNNLSEIN